MNVADPSPGTKNVITTPSQGGVFYCLLLLVTNITAADDLGHHLDR